MESKLEKKIHQIMKNMGGTTNVEKEYLVSNEIDYDVEDYYYEGYYYKEGDESCEEGYYYIGEGEYYQGEDLTLQTEHYGNGVKIQFDKYMNDEEIKKAIFVLNEVTRNLWNDIYLSVWK